MHTHFDGCFDAMEAVWSKRVRGRSLHKLQVAKRRKFDTQILQSIRGLVHNKNILKRNKYINKRQGVLGDVTDQVKCQILALLRKPPHTLDRRSLD